MEVSGAGGTGAAEAAVIDGGEVAELEMLTRALIGITLESLEVLGGEVSLPQFRLLLAASTLGRAPSSRLAEAAGGAAGRQARGGWAPRARRRRAKPLDRDDREHRRGPCPGRAGGRRAP
jgi:hypothetical protein